MVDGALGPLASGAFAALVAVGTTVANERWGGRVGGLIGTMPTTIVPASVGIAATSGTGDNFVVAMCAVPSGMLLSALFLYAWRVIPPRLPAMRFGAQLALATAVTLTLWVAGAVAVVTAMSIVGTDTRTAGIGGALGLLAIIGVGVAACLSSPPSPKGGRKVPVTVLFARGGLAGLAIGVSVWIASLGHPLAAGVSSVFPAIFLTTMIALWWSQGRAVQAGAVGPMMLGSSAVATYALFAAVTFPRVGLAAGALLAWLFAVATTTLPAWKWLTRPR